MFWVYAATSVEFDSISRLELMIRLEHFSAVYAAESLPVIWTAPLSTTIARKYWGNKDNTISLQTDDNGDNLLHERQVAFVKKTVTAGCSSSAWLIMFRNVWMSVSCLMSDLIVRADLRWRLRWSAAPGLPKGAPPVTLVESKMKLSRRFVFSSSGHLWCHNLYVHRNS